MIQISLHEQSAVHLNDSIKLDKMSLSPYICTLSLLFRPISFSWTRNGTHFDLEKDSKVLMKPGSGTLVIDISGEKAEAYEGTYQCTAHNEHGTALSNKIVIRQSSKTSFFLRLITAQRSALSPSLTGCCEAMGSLQRPCLLFIQLAGSPLWSKERNEAIVVQKGVSLVLQCRPPAGLPPPVIFWMDNSESFVWKIRPEAAQKKKELTDHLFDE